MDAGRTNTRDSLTFALVLKAPSIAEAEALADEIRKRAGFFVVYEKSSTGRLRIVAEVAP
jgi:hypothetical protein